MVTLPNQVRSRRTTRRNQDRSWVVPRHETTPRLASKIPTNSLWKDQIQTVLNEKKATLAELENIKGHLTHLACVDRAARHFLGRINHMVTKVNRQNVNQTRQKFL
jgi:hypothetical protein